MRERGISLNALSRTGRISEAEGLARNSACKKISFPTRWAFLGWHMIDRSRTKVHAAHGLRRQYKCVLCGAKMRLKRRQSHPTRGAAYELQTYECRGCGNTLQVNEPTPDAV